MELVGKNEEKAKELYYYHCNEKSCGGFNDCKNCPKSKADESLLKMAAWKEQQMIEKAVEFLNDWFTDDTCNCRIPITKDVREKFFNDFKKYME